MVNRLSATLVGQSKNFIQVIIVENVLEGFPGGGPFTDPDPGYGGSSGGYDQGTIQVGWL